VLVPQSGEVAGPVGLVAIKVSKQVPGVVVLSWVTKLLKSSLEQANGVQCQSDQIGQSQNFIQINVDAFAVKSVIHTYVVFFKSSKLKCFKVCTAQYLILFLTFGVF
jgi:hypothetical protein